MSEVVLCPGFPSWGHLYASPHPLTTFPLLLHLPFVCFCLSLCSWHHHHNPHCLRSLGNIQVDIPQPSKNSGSISFSSSSIFLLKLVSQCLRCSCSKIEKVCYSRIQMCDCGTYTISTTLFKTMSINVRSSRQYDFQLVGWYGSSQSLWFIIMQSGGLWTCEPTRFSIFYPRPVPWQVMKR